MLYPSGYGGVSLATKSDNINHDSTEAARNQLQSEVVDLNKAKKSSLFVLPHPTRKKELSEQTHP